MVICPAQVPCARYHECTIKDGCNDSRVGKVGAKMHEGIPVLDPGTSIAALQPNSMVPAMPGLPWCQNGCHSILNSAGYCWQYLRRRRLSSPPPCKRSSPTMGLLWQSFGYCRIKCLHVTPEGSSDPATPSPGSSAPSLPTPFLHHALFLPPSTPEYLSPHSHIHSFTVLPPGAHLQDPAANVYQGLATQHWR